MNRFKPLTLLQQSQYNRLIWLKREELRLHLKALQQFEIYKLEQRQLEYLVTLPSFQKVEEDIQYILKSTFLLEGAAALNQALQSRTEAAFLTTKVDELSTEMNLT
jgi:hypothetical protein